MPDSSMSPKLRRRGQGVLGRKRARSRNWRPLGKYASFNLILGAPVVKPAACEQAQAKQCPADLAGDSRKIKAANDSGNNRKHGRENDRPNFIPGTFPVKDEPQDHRADSALESVCYQD